MYFMEAFYKPQEKIMKKNLTAFLGGIALVMIATTGIATAQPYGPGSGYGPGNGRGPGMAWGYGSGMMGSGYGAGMMRGCGGAYGSDRMLAALSLTDDQRGKIAKIQEESRSKNWNAMGQMQSEAFKQRQMYFADKLDANAVSDQQRKVDDLRRQMLRSQIETRNEIDALLTPEQRQQFRSFGPCWHEVE
jgi:Spy/CpxP family protein refolding chaperone